MDDSNSIDATELTTMPLECLEVMILGLDATAPGTDFVLSIVRWVAFLLICGADQQDGASMRAAALRGFEMLAILQRFTKNMPLN